MRCARAILVLVFSILIGCATRQVVLPDGAGAGEEPGAPTYAGAALPAGESLTREQAALRALEQHGMVVYFDFDTAEIRAEYRNLIASHAKFLGDGGSRRLRLEGHADERGTREYNVGLGERRAQAVRRALMLQGAGEGQLTTISYGEERPVVSGGDEPAWSQNRRVELRYSP